MKRASVFAVVLFAMGCGASDAQLRKRASFDLECPPETIQVFELDGAARGVAGCGKKAAYVEHCVPRFGGVPECTWSMDSRSGAVSHP